MGKTTILRVKAWQTHQSYKDRKPPWIRFHKSILENYKYHRMSANARALLPMLWLLASEDEDPVSGLIRIGYEEIAFRLRLSTEDVDSGVAECVKGEFIEEISLCDESVTNPLPIRNETVTPETETETETERAIRSLPELEKHPLDGKYRTWFEENCPSVSRIELREELVLYCRSKGKIYKDYWATMQTWGRRRQKDLDKIKPRRQGGNKDVELAMREAMGIA